MAIVRGRGRAGKRDWRDPDEIESYKVARARAGNTVSSGRTRGRRRKRERERAKRTPEERQAVRAAWLKNVHRQFKATGSTLRHG